MIAWVVYGVRRVIRDLDNLAQNDPSFEIAQCAALSGDRGTCAIPPLIGPLDVWRDVAGEGRLTSGFLFPLTRPRDFDRDALFPLPEAFVPAETRSDIDRKPSKAPTPTTGKNPRADFT